MLQTITEQQRNLWITIKNALKINFKNINK